MSISAMLDLLRRRWRSLAVASLTACGVAIGLSGAGAPVERSLNVIDGTLRQRSASGNLHIIEIDARSIGAIDHWPWPRSNYAAVVDRLRDAGAASIAFDVDFSSKSIGSGDETLARSLAAADGHVILPTFGQRAGGGRVGWTDSLPIPILRDHASLAAVSILPDQDGHVRRVPIGTITDGVARPSLSAAIAGVNGAAGEDFPVDLSIDRTTIPRHSFIDIRDGKFDPRVFTGKNVVIGATAIELGDRYAVPNNGVIPGVVIQAMAAETLNRGIPRESGWQLPILLALGMSAMIFRLRSQIMLAAASLGGPALMIGSSIALHSLCNWRFEMGPAILVLIGANAIAGSARWAAGMQQERLQDADTGLPNRLALATVCRAAAGAGIVAARINDFDKLTAGVGEVATADLVRRLRDRIALVEGTDAIYRVEDRVLAWQIFDTETLDEKLSTLRTVMLNPIEVNGRRIDVSLAVGAAIEDQTRTTERTLARAMMAADTAMSNGEHWHLYDISQDESVDRDLSLLGELDEAITAGDISVVYQPKLCLKTNMIVSVEALVRWNHHTRGPLRPDHFIPLAERNDRIAGLTLHVLRRTIEDLLAWERGGRAITGAVNLSAKLLSSSAFLDDLRRLIHTSGIAPTMLTFEVTESAAMTDSTAAVAALQSFRDLGISISIDDYGTGQSTLSYLKQLPLNELKIDRSFVQFAHANRGDSVLVRSTVDLAHELGLKVVAEGVEDQECLDFLKSIGCDLVQGYLISRPIPAEALAAMLNATTELAA